MTINKKILSKIDIDLKGYPQSKLMIVTKNQSVEDIQQLISDGYSLFGENRVQEAQQKFLSIDRQNIELHLIGPLQSNKVKLALRIFDTIQSIDRIKIVDEIIKYKPTNKFFIQINIGQEPQKSGVHPNDFQNLYEYCLSNGVLVEGIMCIPPLEENPIKYFEAMNSIKDKTNKNLKLSMGMSNDYLKALKSQSNIIRVGSLIFS